MCSDYPKEMESIQALQPSKEAKSPKNAAFSASARVEMQENTHFLGVNRGEKQAFSCYNGRGKETTSRGAHSDLSR
jgi:hypothetical protein